MVSENLSDALKRARDDFQKNSEILAKGRIESVGLKRAFSVDERIKAYISYAAISVAVIALTAIPFMIDHPLTIIPVATLSPLPATIFPLIWAIQAQVSSTKVVDADLRRTLKIARNRYLRAAAGMVIACFFLLWLVTSGGR